MRKLNMYCRNPVNYTGITWLKAEQICQEDGGTLASILTEEDQDALDFHFRNSANIYGQFVYIGLQVSPEV